ncbi:Protein D2 isoform X1 [Aphelenchoides bicaudatus]|nr:Protein D2 isoform X1 [Aphelenchoides bicaudatus]
MFVLLLLIDRSMALLSETAGAFTKSEIMPDVIKSVPNEQLQIHYENKSVQLGNVFKLSEAVNAPKVEWPAQTDELYALIKIDPDALSRKNPIYRSWLHWMVLNIPGSRLEKGNTIVKYKGPGAPPTTGFHRYVFLIYKQKAEIKTTFTEFSNEKRSNFNASKFVEENQLEEPLYGNFFIAQHGE